MVKAVRCRLCGSLRKIRRQQKFFRCCSFLQSVCENTVYEADFSQNFRKKVDYNSVITGNERGSTVNEAGNTKACEKTQKDVKECKTVKKGKWVDKGEYYIWEEEADDENEQR